ncbi:5'-nucleotidase SurE [Seminavis robusta]|uniref:5'-nucleotidase SurE n=1 Tax=Seminavis robusta TaxID=568900 RepID=A0A9N8EB68_9STRA|nr:5'-nucleotidase SurE [Seminavis robusta]|eukprot:Sro830_g208200.1 5'-nucleotidase SurE (313) ;mRNA; f:15910-16848
MPLHALFLSVLLFCCCVFLPVSSLRILLTNNNGYSDNGMPLLRDALIAAGHDVFVFAPTTRLNGASAALDLPVVNVTQRDASSNSQEWEVDGYAATCVLVGLSQMQLLLDASWIPDLVISGINDGYTSGSQDWHSGTLGGALTGLSKGVPSLAILTDSPQEVTDSYFINVAQFVVQLVDTLEDVFAEFPLGVGLKIIYPRQETPDAVQGVVLAGNNNYFFVTFDYVLSDTVPNQLEANIVFVRDSTSTTDGATTEDSNSLAQSDSQLVRDGYITALPIQADVSLKATKYNENFLGGLAVMLETMELQTPIAS